MAKRPAVPNHRPAAQRGAPGHRPVSGGLARAAVFGMSDGLVSNVSLVIGFVRQRRQRQPRPARRHSPARSPGAVSMARRRVDQHLRPERARRTGGRRRAPRARSQRVAPSRPNWRRCTRATAWRPTTAQQAAAEVMRSTDEALAVHAREELGVDPATCRRRAARPACRWCASSSGALLAGDPVVRRFRHRGQGHVDRARRRRRGSCSAGRSARSATATASSRWCGRSRSCWCLCRHLRHRQAARRQRFLTPRPNSHLDDFVV